MKLNLIIIFGFLTIHNCDCSNRVRRRNEISHILELLIKQTSCKGLNIVLDNSKSKIPNPDKKLIYMIREEAVRLIPIYSLEVKSFKFSKGMKSTVKHDYKKKKSTIIPGAASINLLAGGRVPLFYILFLDHKKNVDNRTAKEVHKYYKLMSQVENIPNLLFVNLVNSLKRDIFYRDTLESFFNLGVIDSDLLVIQKVPIRTKQLRRKIRLLNKFECTSYGYQYNGFINR